MDVRVLGPVEVVDGDTAVPIGGPRQRLVLALLILHAGETVSTDALVDGVWGDSPPDAARRTVQAYVSNLRRALETVRTDTLVPRPPGYALTVDPEVIDARRFRQDVDRARGAIESDPSLAARLLRDGLALWRGSPFADLAGSPSLRPEITRLEELRRNAIELRIDADLDLGRHHHVIGELETLVAEHPLSERFACQLMLALYRSGRQADALRVARRTRTTLGEELGIDPSPEIRDLEQAILEHDASLEVPTTDAGKALGTGQPTVIRGFEVRRRLGDGEFGITYVAYQRSLDREVALSVLAPKYANDAGFIRRLEAHLAGTIRVTHPNIVPFYDFWHEPGGAYFVRRYFPRGSLQTAIESRSWDAAKTSQFVTQVGSALETAHRHGIYHCDLMPSNVMLDDQDNAYITDFAVPRHVFADDRAYREYAEASAGAPLDDILLSEPVPQTDVYGLAALTLQLVETTERPPVPAVRAVLARGTAPDIAERYPTIRKFVDAYIAAAGVSRPVRPPIAHNPYKGLSAFGEADRADFFGREEFIASLVPRLSSPEPGCLVLVGASGIGKSSILNAGLIPALRDGAIPGSEQWSIVKMHPGVHPYAELAGALRQVIVDADPQVLGHLMWGDIGIGEALSSILEDPAAEIVLVVDQLEELFTLVRDEAVRAAFVESLVDAVDDPDVHLRLVLALRADFYDRPLRYPRLAALLTGCMETVVPMTADELERAIAAPAKQVGAVLDSGLASRIVEDVERQPGMLPLVQYAMTALFDRRDGDRLTLGAYEELGGVRGPLRSRPEEIFGGLAPEARAAARQVFLHLVALGEDGEAARRRVRRSELLSIVGFEHSVRGVVEAFGDARLLSFNQHPVTRSPTVEIAHDALLSEWGRLRGWIDDHRSDVRLHQRLAEATTDWITSERDPEFLLTGGLLERFDGWSKATDLALSDAERSLIEESVEFRDLEEREAAARAAHEREVEERARRRLRMIVALWALAALVAVLAVFAFAQWRRSEVLARQAETVAVADHLAAVAIVEGSHDPQLGLLLSLRAVEIASDAGSAATPTTRGALMLSIRATSEPSELGQLDATSSLDDVIAVARSRVERVLTAEECARYLGLDSCPIETIASPPDMEPEQEGLLGR